MTISPPPYEIITTQDGSPTLRFFNTEVGESMHSHRGAFAETLYIYGAAFAHNKATNNSSAHVISVGLGLGYNEILSICQAIKDDNLSHLFIESYESEDFLVHQFVNWFSGDHSSLAPIYNQVLNLFSEHFQISSKLILSTLKQKYENKSLRLKKSLKYTTPLKPIFNVILFDAFCSKTSPLLWQDDFLEHFISSACANNCVFATYACKGNLNRALIKSGFSLEKREGFANKRQSTLAIR